MNKVSLVNNQIYHIFNRRTEKLPLFTDDNDYHRFISTLEHNLFYDYSYSALVQQLKRADSKKQKSEVIKQLEAYRINSPVEVISFCLMPNHYHLTLKQILDNGISDYMHRTGTAYTNYFNIKQNRKGRLFESTFKRKRVKSDEQLVHLTRYQHLNPINLVDGKKELINYPWSSLSRYLGKEVYSFVSPEMVIGRFKSREDYLDFLCVEVNELDVIRLQDVAIDDDFSWFIEYRDLEEEKKKEFLRLYKEKK